MGFPLPEPIFRNPSPKTQPANWVCGVWNVQCRFWCLWQQMETERADTTGQWWRRRESTTGKQWPEDQILARKPPRWLAVTEFLNQLLAWSRGEWLHYYGDYLGYQHLSWDLLPRITLLVLRTTNRDICGGWKRSSRLCTRHLCALRHTQISLWLRWGRVGMRSNALIQLENQVSNITNKKWVSLFSALNSTKRLETYFYQVGA